MNPRLKQRQRWHGQQEHTELHGTSFDGGDDANLQARPSSRRFITACHKH
jgi:hypothetical protein